MTLDPRGMPFERSAPFRERGEADNDLRAESILLEEFNFAGVTAYQARDDSATLINIFLLATGAMATGLGVIANTYTNGSHATIGIVATAVLGIFTLLSFAFFVRFLALEQEYREGMLAMGVIKEFYIQRLRATMPDIELAFRWRLRKRLRGATLAGGAPLLAATIALLGSLSLAGAVGEGRQVYSILANVNVPYASEPLIFGLGAPYFWEFFAGILAFAAHAAYFSFIARRRRQRTQSEAAKQAERIESALSARD